jgi:hypothetical protein
MEAGNCFPGLVALGNFAHHFDQIAATLGAPAGGDLALAQRAGTALFPTVEVGKGDNLPIPDDCCIGTLGNGLC